MVKYGNTVLMSSTYDRVPYIVFNINMNQKIVI